MAVEKVQNNIIPDDLIIVYVEQRRWLYLDKNTYYNFHSYSFHTIQKNMQYGILQLKDIILNHRVGFRVVVRMELLVTRMIGVQICIVTHQQTVTRLCIVTCLHLKLIYQIKIVTCSDTTGI